MKPIDGSELSLNDFLDYLLSPAEYLLHPSNQFPTDEMLNQFLETVKSRSDREIKDILHVFFMKNSTFKLDMIYKESYENMDWEKYRATAGVNPGFNHTEYFKRLMAHRKQSDSVWEGITWIIDLLPHFPKEALSALDAWYLANCQFLQDSYLAAFSDWCAIIRAKYIDVEVSTDVFLDLRPEEFEFLVAELYDHLGYVTELTKSSYDGGIDVLARKDNVAEKELVIVQCKRYKKVVGVREIRNLLGVVSDRKATKGTLVASCRFSPEAKKLATRNSRIETIDHKQLVYLLNLHLGSLWPVKIDNHLMNQKRKLTGLTNKIQL
jgi:restriction system protein